MREIKFKYVFKHRKDGDYQLEIYTLDEIQERNFFMYIEYWNKVGYELIDRLLFTEIKDKENNEIYDDSILYSTSQLYSDFGRKPTETYDNTYLKIIWMKDSWGCKVIKSNFRKVGLQTKGIEITANNSIVVGDIYSNPELLTKE